ncbi:hypothetical protein IGI04_043063 [Brassica rapa subsp. trilocularis]|uniref:Uncharacterized protein n=1 Tax=Brassica rapa subsp. trilocularis TaxID=1813537 RepID=A0ABQ7KKY2_BRACM|nr:hypothetical protein IGI04_043063 [Brassica rapa subsp. trilocularis]
MECLTRFWHLLAVPKAPFPFPAVPACPRLFPYPFQRIDQMVIDLSNSFSLTELPGGKHRLSLLRSSGDSIRRFDENARTGVVSMFGKVQSLHSDRTLARARSLRSDRAGGALGRYVATELWLELGRYVATERDDRSVAT